MSTNAPAFQPVRTIGIYCSRIFSLFPTVCPSPFTKTTSQESGRGERPANLIKADWNIPSIYFRTTAKLEIQYLLSVSYIENNCPAVTSLSHHRHWGGPISRIIWATGPSRCLPLYSSVPLWSQTWFCLTQPGALTGHLENASQFFMIQLSQWKLETFWQTPRCSEGNIQFEDKSAFCHLKHP